MNAQFRTLRTHRPVVGDPIHPAWCSCSDCTLDRRHSFRLDLLVLGLGAVAALLAVATILLLGIK